MSQKKMIVCTTCGKSVLSWGIKFCSYRCVRLSPERKAQVSRQMRGVNHPFYGTNRSSATRRRIGQTRIRRGIGIGPRNGNWKGGITAIKQSIRMSYEYREWRTAVFRRDGFRCVSCLKRGNGDLEADHIRPFSDILRHFNIRSLEAARQCSDLWDISNGRTLCHQCHTKTDTYGLKKNLRDTVL